MQRRLFGAFLVAEGYVTEGQLQLALEHQHRLRQTRVGDILVAQGAIPRALLERAVLDQIDVAGGLRMRIGEFLAGDGLIRQPTSTAPSRQQERDRGKRLGEILIELGFLDSTNLAEAIRRQLESFTDR